MEKDELAKIKRWLPRGYAKHIYAKTGITFVTIYATINGKTNNQKVLTLAIEMAKVEKARVEAAQNEVSTL